jgi:membrane protein insertase Oxa1/YidC/SpoIIIJ
VFAFNPLQPITDAMLGLLNAIHGIIPSYGVDMILLALVVRVALFPLAQQQFKSSRRRWRSTRSTASTRWQAASRC